VVNYLVGVDFRFHVHPPRGCRPGDPPAHRRGGEQQNRRRDPVCRPAGRASAGEGKDFNAVVAALQEKEAIVERAQTYALTNVILARAEATNRIRQSESYRTRVIASTFAQAAQLRTRQAYQQAPTHLQRAYPTPCLPGARKTSSLPPTPEHRHPQPEDKLDRLLDVTVQPLNP
jgi:hypothetical protein